MVLDYYIEKEGSVHLCVLLRPNWPEDLVLLAGPSKQVTRVKLKDLLRRLREAAEGMTPNWEFRTPFKPHPVWVVERHNGWYYLGLKAIEPDETRLLCAARTIEGLKERVRREVDMTLKKHFQPPKAEQKKERT